MKKPCRSIAGITVIVLMTAAPAFATCGSSARSLGIQRGMPALGLNILALQLAQKGFEQPQGDAERDDDEGKAAKVVGFWKTTFTSDAGLAVDVGFDQYHPDGMENSVDSVAPAVGNVCLGVWEKTGKRHFKVVHPDFNWDASGNVVSIFIERLDFKVSPDATRFSGRFTWDSYDFTGNLISDLHIQGSLTGERITANAPLPFPFPF